MQPPEPGRAQHHFDQWDLLGDSKLFRERSPPAVCREIKILDATWIGPATLQIRVSQIGLGDQTPPTHSD